MGGISRVGDVEVGFNEDWERRWWRIERGGWMVLALFVLLGMSGVFGRGPLSKATAGEAGGPLRVEYERMARNHTPTVITAYLRPMGAGEQTVWLSRDLLDGMPISRVVPQPASASATADGQLYAFRLPAGSDSAKVEFYVEPGRVGRRSGRVALAGTPPLTLKQFVFP